MVVLSCYVSVIILVERVNRCICNWQTKKLLNEVRMNKIEWNRENRRKKNIEKQYRDSVLS